MKTIYERIVEELSKRDMRFSAKGKEIRMYDYNQVKLAEKILTDDMVTAILTKNICCIEDDGQTYVTLDSGKEVPKFLIKNTKSSFGFCDIVYNNNIIYATTIENYQTIYHYYFDIEKCTTYSLVKNDNELLEMLKGGF